MKKLGLALGAGSSKGFAHIGVLQVLTENKIPISMIAGSSMGAVIGGIYASGGDMHILEKYIKTLNLYEKVDLSLNGGLIKGEKFEELIRIFTHDYSIGDTPIPFYCSAVNIRTGELYEFEKGKLHRAIRASMSIPGLFQPVNIDNEIYVDAGVISRVPSELIIKHGADVILGVDVGYRGEGFIGDEINPYNVINHSFDILQWEKMKIQRNREDILLLPKVRFVKGRFSTDSITEVVQEGRRVATEALGKLRELLDD